MSVLAGPFAVVDYAGRQSLQAKVGHAVRADDHGALLFMECIHDSLQGIWTAIQVIAIQLHGKPSASGIAYGKVPASAYAQVGAFGDEVDNFLFSGIAADGFGSSVRGVIVNDNQVIMECRFLFQYGTDSIVNGPYPVPDRDNNRGFAREIAFV